MTNNISKEAIAKTLKLQDDYLLAKTRNLPIKTKLNLSSEYQFKLMQQVRELDTLVDTLAALLDKAANTNIAELGEIERLIYEARDKIKQVRGLNVSN